MSSKSDCSESDASDNPCLFVHKIKQMKSCLKDADSKIRKMRKIASKEEDAIKDQINEVKSLREDIKENENLLLRMQADDSNKQSYIRGQVYHTIPVHHTQGHPVDPRSWQPPPYFNQLYYYPNNFQTSHPNDPQTLPHQESLSHGHPVFNSKNEPVQNGTETFKLDEAKIDSIADNLLKALLEDTEANREPVIVESSHPPYTHQERAHHLDQVQTLASKLKSSEEHRAVLSDRCRQLELDNRCLLEEGRQMRLVVEELRRSGRSMQVQLEEFKVKMKESEVNLENMKSENERLIEKTTKKKTKMKEFHSKVESLTSELKVVQGGRGSIEGLKREITSLMEERMHLEGRLRMREEEVEELRKRLQESRDLLKDVKLNMQMLERDLNLLTEDKKKLQLKLLHSSNPHSNFHSENALVDHSWSAWTNQEKDMREAALFKKLMSMEKELSYFKDFYKTERKKNEPIKKKMAPFLRNKGADVPASD